MAFMQFYSRGGLYRLSKHQLLSMDMDDMQNGEWNWNEILCHFTSFESALRIIGSKILLFGNFQNMNDIAEVKRESHSMYPEAFENELRMYKGISLTYSSDEQKAFEIDPLWGHYAQKGNGICLMFDKKELLNNYREQFPDVCIPENLKIRYSENFTNAAFTDNDYDGLRQLKQSEVVDIFYTKHKAWEYENELRLIARSDREKIFLELKDCLLGIIVCFPKEELADTFVDYKVLRKILPKEKPIFRYDTKFGNKGLYDENQKKIWPKGYIVDGDTIKEHAKIND